MRKKTLGFLGLCQAVMIVIWLTLSGAFAAETPSDLLRILREHDAKMKKSFTIIATVEQPIHWQFLDQGVVVYRGVMTTDGTNWGIALTDPLYPMPLTFKPKGVGNYQSIDYDKDGSLIIWKPKEQYVLRAPDLEAVFYTWVMNRISPQGQVSEEGSGSRDLNLYRPSDNQCRFKFDYLLWAAGRGFSARLSAITSVEQTREGLLRVLASGESLTKGTWELIIDPKMEYLVRSASFTPDTATAPLYKVTTFGRITREDGLSIAQGGRVTVVVPPTHELHTTVTILSFKQSLDQRLIESLQERMRTQIPKGTRILDYRNDLRHPTITQQ